jgi:hypothetical protein
MVSLEGRCCSAPAEPKDSLREEFALEWTGLERWLRFALQDGGESRSCHSSRENSIS